MKVIISAGGTGGHIYPALAIINELKKQESYLEVLYIGTHNRMENKIVPELNIPYQSLKIYGFSKTDMKRNFLNIGYLIKSYYKCIDIIKEFKPDIIIGVGGYVTMPVLMAAKKCKIKCVIHEQNSIPGKTNKFLSRGVDKVFVSFKESIKYFSDKSKCVYTGNPSGDNVNNLKVMSKTTLGLSKNKKLVLITSGSLGSSSLNQKLKDFLKCVKSDDFEVLMITGDANYEEFISDSNYSSNVKVLPYLNNLASLFKNTDLIISRAGAGTISEIMAAKVPSILIPSPYVANNHQYYNAKEISDNKLALMEEEKELDGTLLYKKVKELLDKDNLEYKLMQENLIKQNKESSSQLIYKEIKELVKNG